MKTQFRFRTPHSALRARRAFTLIELLVVLSVIGLMAALTFPAIAAVKKSMLKARVKAELLALQTTIENFKDKMGYYPPDNKMGNPEAYALNQLYYELHGVTNIATANAPIYETLDGSAKIAAADLGAVFGPNVTGFMNCAKPRSGDEMSGGHAFVRALKVGQYRSITTGGKSCTIMGSGVDGPFVYTSDEQNAKINPWRYNVSNPHYNKTFDLWMDVMVGDKTNRICNWSDRPLVVSQPYQY